MVRRAWHCLSPNAALAARVFAAQAPYRILRGNGAVDPSEVRNEPESSGAKGPDPEDDDRINYAVGKVFLFAIFPSLPG
jgi:hypothetical protein